MESRYFSGVRDTSEDLVRFKQINEGCIHIFKNIMCHFHETRTYLLFFLSYATASEIDQQFSEFFSSKSSPASFPLEHYNEVRGILDGYLEQGPLLY